MRAAFFSPSARRRAHRAPGAGQVFLSGALHGNERLGPTTVIELASLLLAQADPDPEGLYATAWPQLHDNAWLRRLLRTRVLVIVPMTNAAGYYHVRAPACRPRPRHAPTRLPRTNARSLGWTRTVISRPCRCPAAPRHPVPPHPSGLRRYLQSPCARAAA